MYLTQVSSSDQGSTHIEADKETEKQRDERDTKTQRNLNLNLNLDHNLGYTTTPLKAKPSPPYCHY
jgi:hypothetical protein